MPGSCSSPISLVHSEIVTVQTGFEQVRSTVTIDIDIDIDIDDSDLEEAPGGHRRGSVKIR